MFWGIYINGFRLPSELLVETNINLTMPLIILATAVLILDNIVSKHEQIQGYSHFCNNVVIF